MPFFKRDGETGRELTAFRLLDDGKTVLDIAQELRISIDKSQEYQAKWAKARSELQNKAFNMFAQGKDFMTVATEMGVKIEVIEELYRMFLKYQKRQEQIKKEVSEEDNKTKKYNPPFYVTKLVKNPYTGRGYVVEKCPSTWDEPPKSWTDFEAFARNMGDGEYWIMDNDGKKTGRINVNGLGFNDPSELDEMGYGGDGLHRNARHDRGTGNIRRPGMLPGQMVPDGMYGGGAQDPYGYQANPEEMAMGMYPPVNPIDREARRILNTDTKTKELYYRIAEMAYRQGRPDESAKYLQMAENYGKIAPPPGQEPRKSFIDELVEGGSNKDKMDILKRIFGGDNGGKDKDKDDEEKDPELRKMKMYGDIAKDLIPQVKDNIIDPLMEGITGESRGMGQLEREAFDNNPRSINGSGWKAEQTIRPRPRQMQIQRQQPHVPLEREESMGPPRQQPRPQLQEGFSKVGNITPKQIKHVAVDEVKQRVEMDSLYSGDVDDEMEMKKADDYGQPILKEELEDTTKFSKTESVGDGEIKMGIDEKYMINRGFPKFKHNIIEWKAAKDRKDSDAERENSPEKIAREDYHMMAKSNYAAFIGKKRLLKAYHTAKKGYDSIVGSYKKFIEKKLMEATTDGMDFAAEKLRDIGTDEFAKVWDPPDGMNKKAAIKMLFKYIILKDCWAVFISDYGREWFTKYCNEFVKAVDEDYNADDKRARIRNMLQTGPNLPGKGKIIDPGPLSPIASRVPKEPKPIQPKVIVKKAIKIETSDAEGKEMVPVKPKEVDDNARRTTTEKINVGKDKEGASGGAGSSDGSGTGTTDGGSGTGNSGKSDKSTIPV